MGEEEREEDEEVEWENGEAEEGWRSRMGRRMMER